MILAVSFIAKRYLAFIDYQKAFDSVKNWALMVAMVNVRIDTRYVSIIRDIYEGATLHVKINEDQKTGKIHI